MSNPTGKVVGDDRAMAGSLPVSRSSEVLLSPDGGGCGRAIPYHKDDGLKSLQNGKIWCGLESSAMPGMYFCCAECHYGE